jgi:hypothetical protein
MNGRSPGAFYEIRSTAFRVYRGVREYALEAAQFLKQRSPGCAISVVRLLK